jgi:hypothetical protein
VNKSRKTKKSTEISHAHEPWLQYSIPFIRSLYRWLAMLLRLMVSSVHPDHMHLD